jgi:acyl carrier protein
MTNEEIHAKLQDVFRTIFDDDNIVLTADTTADDIEKWDSLNQVRIILACQQVFNVKLNARKVNTLENVGQMIDYLSAALKRE